MIQLGEPDLDPYTCPKTLDFAYALSLASDQQRIRDALNMDMPLGERDLDW